MKKINPFQPNSPVAPGMFAGRQNEIDALKQGLQQTKHGNPMNFLVTGERGIGKSSLVNYIKFLADGSIKSPDFEQFNFVTINIAVSEKMSLVTLIKLIERNIKRQVGKVEKVRNFLDDTWGFIQRIRVMDSGIDKAQSSEDPDLILDELAYSLSATSKRLTSPEKGEERKDGIVFFIDEADNASSELRIGYFFKLLTELLQQDSCGNIMFVAAGLPETTEKLYNSHESSIRVFSELKIRELEVPERYYVIDRGIEEGNEKNTDQTKITKDAKGYISTLSEGYPHFIQQFSFSAFEFNDDGEISAEDVLEGAFRPCGALDAIGSRYYASRYHEQIKSDEYREVLSIMAENLNAWTTRKEINENFSGTEHTLNNALQTLTNRKIILRNPSKRGEYRLQQKGFALWIKLFGERKK
ncbi:AAA family ATPase [Guyparkeria sp.]|uniref:AAA family ATPase n=1 Tax=Guyparkeria sp. TaxID=2035736 RepID=UPI00397108F2